MRDLFSKKKKKGGDQKERQIILSYTHIHTQIRTHKHVLILHTHSSHIIHLEKFNLVKCRKKDILTFEKFSKNTLLRKED